MTLLQKQHVFAESYARLILKAIELNYQVTLGQTLRTQLEANLNAANGIGIKQSLHLLKLAGDLNLFKDGVLLMTKEDYLPLGEWWESQSTPDYEMCWGGRFQRVDADHFSISNQGIK